MGGRVTENTSTQLGRPNRIGLDPFHQNLPVKAMQATRDLPAHVDRILEEFIAAARQACGNALHSVVLYGSGAEGKLRATSDVNLVSTLTEFTPQIAYALREPLRAGQAAARLAVMFLLESEVPTAVNAYPSEVPGHHAPAPGLGR